MSVLSTKLHDLARRINDREAAIEQLRSRTCIAASEAVAEALLQGQDLIAAKAELKHGLWMDWLKAHCPKSVRHAQRYMLLARNAPRVSYLDEADSIRGALMLCDSVDKEQTESKRWPAYLEAINRTSKLVKFFDSNAFDSWPVEGVERLKEQWRPIAVKLWPDKFVEK